MPLAPDDPRHGTTNGYNNLRCRCDACKEANRQNHAAYVAKLREEGRVIGQHGSRTCYDSGCRCQECKAAHNERSRTYKRERRQKTGVDHLLTQNPPPKNKEN